MNNIQIQTAVTVTDKISTAAQVSEHTRLHTELELQFGGSVSTLKTSVKSCEGK